MAQDPSYAPKLPVQESRTLHICHAFWYQKLNRIEHALLLPIFRNEILVLTSTENLGRVPLGPTAIAFHC